MPTNRIQTIAIGLDSLTFGLITSHSIQPTGIVILARYEAHKAA